MEAFVSASAAAFTPPLFRCATLFDTRGYFADESVTLAGEPTQPHTALTLPGRPLTARPLEQESGWCPCRFYPT